MRRRDLRAEVEPIAVRRSEAGSVLIHATLALGGGLLGLKWPLVGAAVCLAAAFSFYAERALGMSLLGRLVPKRKSQNVISPPPGPVWSGGISVVLSAGYDIPDSYPVGDWLSRRLSGRLTTDRIVLWAGMMPLFAATMFRVAEIDSFGVDLVQLLSSAALLSMIVAQFDRLMAGRPIAGEDDLAAPEMLLEALDELLEAGDQAGEIGVCLFGSESASAAGADEFFRHTPRELAASNVSVVNFVAADRSAERVQVTEREGDLATLKMSTELADECEVEPEAVIYRTYTGAVAARRRGLRAVTLIGQGEDGVDTGLDLADAGLASVAVRTDAIEPDDGETADPDRTGGGTADSGDGSAESPGDSTDSGEAAAGSDSKPAGEGTSSGEDDRPPRKRNVTRNITRN